MKLLTLTLSFTVAILVVSWQIFATIAGIEKLFEINITGWKLFMTTGLLLSLAIATQIIKNNLQKK